MPTLPTVAIRLLGLYDDPDVELNDIVKLLRSDPAITAKIMMAANSSAYGIGREVSELRQAVSLLGKSIVAPLALSFSLSEKSMHSKASAELFRQYWLQAIIQAITAETLAKKYQRSQAGEWFIAGLLSSIGRLALINHDPDAYGNVLEFAEAERISLDEAERQLLETTTVQLSTNLLNSWKLPQRWIEATRRQLELVELVDQVGDLPVGEQLHSKLFLAVATASAVASYFCRTCQGDALVRIVHLMEEGFGVEEDEVYQLIDDVRARLEEVAHLFQVQSSMLGSPTELMSLAMQHLADLAVSNAMARQSSGSLLERIERLTRRSTIDTVTGAYNRAYFEERFSEELSNALVASKFIGLLFADVDHFKSINDTYGHIAGDEVLKQIAQRLKAAIRSSDLLARFGGEEFVVLISNPCPDELYALGERLRALVEQREFVFGNHTIPVTISVGAAAARPVALDGFTERLIASADKAMYEAKRRGRNRVVIASATRDPLASPSVALAGV